MNVPGTIAHTTVVRADALAVGDIIPGGDAVNGHRVLSVSQVRTDPMLGSVVVVTVRQVPNYPDEQVYYMARDYIFRPSDRLHVER